MWETNEHDGGADSKIEKGANMDLKRKVDITETEKELNGTVKEQLEEALEAIMKLGDAIRKLMTQVEDVFLLDDRKDSREQTRVAERKTRVLLRGYHVSFLT
ncbi:hypothetical protein V6N13_021884 [Hibiscus sabdariffa]